MGCENLEKFVGLRGSGIVSKFNCFDVVLKWVRAPGESNVLGLEFLGGEIEALRFGMRYYDTGKIKLN